MTAESDRTMASHTDEHRRLTIDQFTRQAIPFSLMRNHSPELILREAGITTSDTVLDVACGPGLMACEFAAVARHVTGIDVTLAMIERAKVLQESRAQTNVLWLVGDVAQLPFRDSSFSVVFTRYSVHHFLDPRAVLAEMARVCSPQGRLVIVDVFTSDPEQAERFNRMEKLRDPSHVRALSLHELRGLVDEVGCLEVTSQFYKHEFALEQVLKASYPNPGDDDTIREMFENDEGLNRLGLGICRKHGGIHFAYPIVILVGRKR